MRVFCDANRSYLWSHSSYLAFEGSWLGLHHCIEVIKLTKAKFDLCHGLRPTDHNQSPMDVKKTSTYITVMTVSKVPHFNLKFQTWT